MVGRTWFAVLAGSVVLWSVSQIGQGLSPLDPPAAGDFFPSATVTARRGADAVAACLERVASFGVSAVADLDPGDDPSVAGRYRRECRPLFRGSGLDVFVFGYGERSRDVVIGIVEREARLAAELVAGPQGATLDPDVVWAAALIRAAADVREFTAELFDWFAARDPADVDQSASSPGDLPG